jgi:lysophospholipase
MKTPLNEKYCPLPALAREWWEQHATLFKLKRQGLDLVCATFEQPPDVKALGNIFLLTGWSESFLKYGLVIKAIYERGFNIFTYDHQSQGLSGRWLSEPQSTWVHSFDDYVDDFVFFVTTVIPNDKQSLPKYILAHSMGGLISAIAMSRHPTQFRRAALCAPMFRNKCGMKAVNYVYPFPQPVAYYITMFTCWLGLGTKPTLGYFKG